MGKTVSHVTFDDLPASVRELQTDVNPLKDGILMSHQVEWIRLCGIHDLMIADKGRRTGITYATALDANITAGSQLSAGGDNIYYIGDTKEKGLEFIGYCAHFAKIMATAMAKGFAGIEVFLFDDQDENGETRQITAYRIRYASGFQVVALSSNPANIRGLQGIVVIDEAAYHANVGAVLDACMALIMWGGKIRVISTHNGMGNAFNELIKGSRLGENAFYVFSIFFDDAVENGLYERVCLVKGWTPTLESKREWYNKVRGAYGSNKAAMLEELDGVPREGTGVAIPGIIIENCMHEVRPILRMSLQDDFAVKTNAYRHSWCEDWITENLAPLLADLPVNLEHVFGQDYARHADFTVIAPCSIEPDLVRKVPFIIELKNVPPRQQHQVLWALIKGLPNFRRGSMDATGPGATIAENIASDVLDEFGEDLIDQIMLNEKWYRENMVPFQSLFEDQMFDIPRDADIKNDLRALQMINGIIKLPAVRQRDTKNNKFFRHGDSAIALAMVSYAADHIEEQTETYKPMRLKWL